MHASECLFFIYLAPCLQKVKVSIIMNAVSDMAISSDYTSPIPGTFLPMEKLCPGTSANLTIVLSL